MNADPVLHGGGKKKSSDHGGQKQNEINGGLEVVATVQPRKGQTNQQGVEQQKSIADVRMFITQPPGQQAGRTDSREARQSHVRRQHADRQEEPAQPRVGREKKDRIGSRNALGKDGARCVRCVRQVGLGDRDHLFGGGFV